MIAWWWIIVAAIGAGGSGFMIGHSVATMGEVRRLQDRIRKMDKVRAGLASVDDL